MPSPLAGDPEPTDLVGITKFHNDFRSAVNPPAATPLPPLKWNAELAQVAQAYAEECIFGHNGDRTSQQATFTHVGENIYGSSVTDFATVWPAGVTAWHAEVSDYNHAANSCSAVCGHYTQIVWETTTDVGCGIYQCSSSLDLGPNAAFLVCNYGPAGNFNGEKPYVAA